MVETKYVDALTFINLENDWMVDSGCGHHLTEDQSKSSSLQEYDANEAKVTTNTVTMVVLSPTIKAASPPTSGDERVLSLNSSPNIGNNNNIVYRTTSCTTAPELLEEIEWLRKENMRLNHRWVN